MQNKIKIKSNKTNNPTFNIEAIDIHHHSCPPSYTHMDDLSKTTCLHIYKYDMLVELCAKNYAFDGFV